MKKTSNVKHFRISAAVIAIVLLAILLAACGAPPSEGSDADTHEHLFVNYVYNNDATCAEDGTETAKCEYCAETDTRQSADTATGEHSYDGLFCSVCGVYSDTAPITEGLSFSERKDGEEVVGYWVSGIGEAIDTEILIPQSYNDLPVTGIDNRAFSGCADITYIVVPNTVKIIGFQAFYQCKGLTSIELCEGLDGIGYGAFYGCKNLSEIVIPNGVRQIGYNIFFGCTALSSVELPDSLTYIGQAVFVGCDNLKSIKFDGTIEQWEAISKDRWEEYGSVKTIVCSDGTVTV